MTTQLIGNKTYTYETTEVLVKNTTYHFLETKIDGVFYHLQIKKLMAHNRRNPSRVFWSYDEATQSYKNQDIRLHILKLETLA